MTRLRPGLWVVGVLLGLSAADAVRAHPLGLAALRIQASPSAADTYSVTWRISARESRLIDPPTLPAACIPQKPAVRQREGASLVTRWTVRCDGGLAGDIARSGEGQVEVIISIFGRDGGVQRGRLTPEMGRYSVTPEAAPSALQPTVRRDGTIAAFLILGFEHVLEGWDHLLFVLLLLLLAWPPGHGLSWTKLAAAITGFTLAHSVTLGLSVTGLVQLPGPPVEAVIAWSVVVAAAAVLKDRSRSPMTWNHLLAVAGGFGLLHGFGFAGALGELLGASSDGLAAALIGFNVGVELGQLCFAAGVVALGFLIQRHRRPWFWPDRIAGYGAGLLAAFWMWERVAAF